MSCSRTQVLKWIFDGGAGSFDDMANIPKALRAKLAKVATVGVLEVGNLNRYGTERNKKQVSRPLPFPPLARVPLPFQVKSLQTCEESIIVTLRRRLQHPRVLCTYCDVSRK